MPKQALIMIDMQRGFLDSASPLCIPSAEATVPRARRLSTCVTQLASQSSTPCAITAATARMWKTARSRVGSRRQAALGGLRRAPVGMRFRRRSPFCRRTMCW